MVLVHVFEYVFQEVSGHVGEFLLTLDSKEKNYDDVEQKEGIL